MPTVEHVTGAASSSPIAASTSAQRVSEYYSSLPADAAADLETAADGEVEAAVEALFEP